jgi:cytochrome c
VMLEGGILSLDIHNDATGEIVDSATLVKICVVGEPCGSVVAPREPDLARGKQQMNTCFACHQWNQNDTGPKLEKLFGKRAAKVVGFAYSDDMKETRVRWDSESIDAFLANPQKVIPHNQMVLVPMTDRSKRRDLLAYMLANGFRQ